MLFCMYLQFNPSCFSAYSAMAMEHKKEKKKIGMKKEESRTDQKNKKSSRKYNKEPVQDGFPELWWVAGLSTCIKLLLIPSYHSTDLEVHRNWMAITSSLPIDRWYFDETSQWTLDYPPFFAWYELLLSLFARLIDPVMVDLREGMEFSKATHVIYFQRFSVIFSDLLLYFALWQCVKRWPSNLRRLVVCVAVLLSPGLFMVDHVHFQYNGFLLGMLILSITYIRDGEDLKGGILFAILLCFKHLFAVAAPIFFVYLLRHYCKDLFRFLKLGGSVICVVLAAFGPFIYYRQRVDRSLMLSMCESSTEQMDQVLRRLFPFGRGLCHAYWAPNVWALYNIVDKVLGHLLRKLGFHVELQEASMTGGLVGDSKLHVVLPQITPLTTMVLVILTISPCLLKLWKRPRKEDVIFSVAYAYYCGFMFGWHVHEKACLHFLIPLSLVAVKSLNSAQEFFFLSIVSYYSLFPLLFEPREYPIKVTLLVLYSLVMWVLFSINFQSHNSEDTPSAGDSKYDHDDRLTEQGISVKLLGHGELAYMAGLILVEIYGQFFHNVAFKGALPFLPLMLTSVYCALGMLYIWIKQFLYVCNLR